MALGTFSATVGDWAQKSHKRMEFIFREGSKRTGSLSQSGIPVDTGFARASFRASNSSMPSIDKSASNPGRVTVGYDPGPIIAVIASAQLGSTIFLGYTANYVGKLESGYSKKAPSGFVRLAAMQWPHTVSEVVGEAKARVG